MEPYEMVEDLYDVDDDKLSMWECNFIESIDDQLGDDRDLTDTQIDKLTEIWEKHC